MLPNPCHYQDYERSMFPPDQPGSEGCTPKICADEVGDEDEGQFRGYGIGGPIQ